MLREFSVEYGENSKRDPREDSPEDSFVGGVFQVKLWNDEKNTQNAKKSNKDVYFDQFFPEKKRFQKSGEHRIAGEREKADSDCGDLYGLKKRNPVDREKNPEKEEKHIIFFRRNL